MKPFRIFRPGKHTASCGTQVEFTKEDLAKAVQSYNTQLYAAPLVIGHPKTEDRAYGWAEKLTMDDAGDVWAHPEKVNPTFGGMVEEGAYRNRSASWYMPDHPNNPVPGVLYPKHIGFLGAMPPALKGLGDVEFTEGRPVDFSEDAGPVLQFAATDDAIWGLAGAVSAMARLFRRLRDQRIEEKGIEDADQLIPDYAISDAEATATALRELASKNAGLLPAFNEPSNPTEGTSTMTPEQIQQLQRERDEARARVASFTERETAIAAAERLATVSAIDAQLEPLVRAGKVLPAHRKTLANFAADLADDEASQTIEFGEAAEGQAAPKVSPRAFLLGFLNALPKSVDYSEVGGQTTRNGGALSPRELAQKAGDLRDKVKRETGREMSFTEATNQVIADLGVTVEEPNGTPAV